MVVLKHKANVVAAQASQGPVLECGGLFTADLQSAGVRAVEQPDDVEQRAFA
jgi:hypothetical protein